MTDHPSDMADMIGRKRIADAAGVGLTAVGNAIARGHFPPAWFLVVKALCDERGLDCPPQAFGMKLMQAAE